MSHRSLALAHAAAQRPRCRKAAAPFFVIGFVLHGDGAPGRKALPAIQLRPISRIIPKTERLCAYALFLLLLGLLGVHPHDTPASRPLFSP